MQQSEKYSAVLKDGFLFAMNPVLQISCAGLCKGNSFAFCASSKRLGSAACLGQLCQVATSPCRFPESCAGGGLRQFSGSLSFPLEMFFCEGNHSMYNFPALHAKVCHVTEQSHPVVLEGTFWTVSRAIADTKEKSGSMRGGNLSLILVNISIKGEIPLASASPGLEIIRLPFKTQSQYLRSFLCCLYWMRSDDEHSHLS